MDVKHQRWLSPSKKNVNRHGRNPECPLKFDCHESSKCVITFSVNGNGRTYFQEICRLKSGHHCD